MIVTVWKSRGMRGDVLEELLLMTNQYYKSQKLARVDKISVPIKVLEIDQRGMITKAFFEKKSTVDFQGIIQGVGVAFDAKETHQKSFPLKNIHMHQIEFMKDIDEQGGLAFLIVHFKFCDDYFLLPYEWLVHYVEIEKRQSIPYSIMPAAFKIERPSASGILNYLPVLNAYVAAKAIWKETGDVLRLSVD